MTIGWLACSLTNYAYAYCSSKALSSQPFPSQLTLPPWPIQLVIYGIDSVLIPEESLPVDEYNYGALLNGSLEFYRSQWVGSLEGQDVPSWRGDAFTYEVGPSSLDWGDITGGVMEGGDAGGLKGWGRGGGCPFPTNCCQLQP